MKRSLAIRCSSCGAAHSGSGYQCNYCGSALVDKDGHIVTAPKEFKDFGWSGVFPVILSIVIAFLIYYWGWSKAKTDGYVRDAVIVIWFGVVPLWVIFMSSIWKTKSRITFLAGLLYALPFFPLHLFVWSDPAHYYSLEDSVPYAAMFYGTIYAAWFTGRIIHMAVRKRLN